MRVLVIGDVHGRHLPLADVLRQAQLDYRVGAAIQVGDFGFSKAAWGAQTVRFPLPLHAIDGNHEDHRWLRQAVRQGLADRWTAESNLIYQPRPSIAVIGGLKVGFLGGALHVDRPQRHSLLTGWPNYILRQQCDRAAKLFNREHPDLLVTHSCPAGIGIGMHGTQEQQPGVAEHIAAAGFDPGPQDDCGEAELGRLWRALDYRPRAWVFGHFHTLHRAEIKGTQFTCVSDDLTSPTRRLVLWDTEEKKLLFVPADPSA